uniref:Uncharacterized protein n=1 Tax=Aphis craccivora nege-like virus 1 TaxID=2961853 RepID=A0A976RX42_9VIRU|nr:hypothetical protein 1 [Aphis craccivora nege-like virus 1]
MFTNYIIISRMLAYFECSQYHVIKLVLVAMVCCVCTVTTLDRVEAFTNTIEGVACTVHPGGCVVAYAEKLARCDSSRLYEAGTVTCFVAPVKCLVDKAITDKIAEAMHCRQLKKHEEEKKLHDSGNGGNIVEYPHTPPDEDSLTTDDSREFRLGKNKNTITAYMARKSVMPLIMENTYYEYPLNYGNVLAMSKKEKLAYNNPASARDIEAVLDLTYIGKTVTMMTQPRIVSPYLHRESKLKFNFLNAEKWLNVQLHRWMISMLMPESSKHNLLLHETDSERYTLNYDMEYYPKALMSKSFLLSIRDQPVTFTNVSDKNEKRKTLYSTTELFYLIEDENYSGCLVSKLCSQSRKFYTEPEVIPKPASVTPDNFYKIFMSTYNKDTKTVLFSFPSAKFLRRVCTKICYDTSEKTIFRSLPLLNVYEVGSKSTLNTEWNDFRSNFDSPTSVSDDFITLVNGTSYCISEHNIMPIPCVTQTETHDPSEQVTLVSELDAVEKLSASLIHTLIPIYSEKCKNKIRQYMKTSFTNFVLPLIRLTLNAVVQFVYDYKIVNYVAAIFSTYLITRDVLSTLLYVLTLKIFSEILINSLHIYAFEMTRTKDHTSKDNTVIKSKNQTDKLTQITDRLDMLTKNLSRRRSATLSPTTRQPKTVVRRNRLMRRSFAFLLSLCGKILYTTVTKPYVLMHITTMIFLWMSERHHGTGSWFQTKFKIILQKYLDNTSISHIMEYEKKILSFLAFLPFLYDIPDHGKMLYLVVSVNWVIFSPDRTYWHYSIEAVLLFLLFKLRPRERNMFTAIAVTIFIAMQLF